MEELELDGSNLNKTESTQPHSLDSVPDEHSLVHDMESDTLNTINQEVIEDHVENKETRDHDDKKDVKGSNDTDVGLAKNLAEKRLALIKAWEDSEKTKAENRAHKKQSAVTLWEESKKSSIEAQLKKFEDNLERKKVEYIEKMKNEIAEIHLYAEEERADVEAQKREEFLKLEEIATKFIIHGVAPKKFFACFSA